MERCANRGLLQLAEDTTNELRSSHTHQLARMQADRRVLSRTSKEFLEGKSRAETALTEAQAALAAAESGARERARQLKGATAAQVNPNRTLTLTP